MSTHFSTRRPTLAALWIVTVIVLASNGMRPVEQEQETLDWGDLPQLVKSEDVADRQRAARYLATQRSHEREPEIVLPLIEATLSDSDDNVRAMGAAAAAAFAYGHFLKGAQKQEDPGSLSLQLGQSEELFHLLMRAALDSTLAKGSEDSRVAAIRALMYLYWDRPDFAEGLIGLYRGAQSEDAKPLRRQILAAAGYGHVDSPEVIEIMFSELRSDDGLRQLAASILGDLKPNDGLAALVEAYASENEREIRWSIFQALMKYMNGSDRLAKVVLDAQEESRTRIGRLEELERAMNDLEASYSIIVDDGPTKPIP